MLALCALRTASVQMLHRAKDNSINPAKQARSNRKGDTSSTILIMPCLNQARIVSTCPESKQAEPEGFLTCTECRRSQSSPVHVHVQTTNSKGDVDGDMWRALARSLCWQGEVMSPKLDDIDTAPPRPVLLKLCPLPEWDADAEDDPDGEPAPGTFMSHCLWLIQAYADISFDRRTLRRQHT